MNRLDCDFYAVEFDPSNGNKRIHVLGYCYYAGDTQGNGLEYRHLEFCWNYLPIGFTSIEYKGSLNRCKQYISDHDEDGVIEQMDSYRATPLPYSEVTQDTQCGIYVDL